MAVLSRVRGLTLLSPVLAGILCMSCGGDDHGPDAAVGGVHPRFELGADPMPFGAIPWPDDLYLDEAGHIHVGELAGESASFAPEYFDALRTGLADLDGFGVVSPVIVYFDGLIDPSTVPSTPADSLREDSSVMLVDVDSSSPDAFSRVPIRVRWVEEDRRLAIRPEDGHPLAEGRTYAAIVTTKVEAGDGQPIEPHPSFEQIRDASMRPTDELDAEAFEHYNPVLESLAANGMARAEIAALAVFRVQTVTDELSEIRERVWGLPPPSVELVEVTTGTMLDDCLGVPVEEAPGLDVEGGVAHTAIGWMVHARFDSPSFVSDTPHVHGRFTRDDMGRLAIKSSDSVPFTLFVPRTADLNNLPVIIFQHGLGGERSDALGVANALNAAGYAVIAPDMPFHGLRARGLHVDESNRFTEADSPDLFGDRTGGTIVAELAGIEDSAGELIQFHPIYLRESLRQAVVDLLVLTRVVRDGDWAAIVETDGLADLGLSAAPLGVIGNSLGGMVMTMFAAVEPEVGAALLSVTGGHLMMTVIESPPFNSGYVPLLWPILGLDLEVDYSNDHPIYRPEVMIWQTLLDRGDPIGFGGLFDTRHLDVFMLMARHDETLNNIATESLARAVGAAMVDSEPAHTDLQIEVSPVRANVAIDGAMATRGVYVHEPATHGLLLRRMGSSEFAHPVQAPFTPVEEAAVANPNEAAIGQMLHFFESWRSGAAEVAAPSAASRRPPP